MHDTQIEEIAALVEQLYSTEVGGTIYGPGSRAQLGVPRQLLSIASRSSEARDKVIRALIRLLEDNADGGEDLAFSTACDLLGKLRAVEAIDTLVKYLDYQPGHIGTSLNSRPAVKGLISIGEAAVPKIAEALRSQFDDHLLIFNATTALKNIGGVQAKQALELAYSVEHDATRKEFLQLAIQEIERASGRPGNVVTIKAPKTKDR